MPARGLARSLTAGITLQFCKFNILSAKQKILTEKKTYFSSRPASQKVRSGRCRVRYGVGPSVYRGIFGRERSYAESRRDGLSLRFTCSGEGDTKVVPFVVRSECHLSEGTFIILSHAQGIEFFGIHLHVELAVYIRAGLETKQIARMLMLQPGSVKMNRHRLRERMGLGPDERLEEVLSRLVREN